VPHQPSKAPLRAEAPDGQPVRPVLYIEDNPINAMLMDSMLRLLGGPPLVVAECGADGLRQAQALNPVLILLDIELPDMNGYQVLQGLQQHPGCRAIPVVAVSANAMPGDVAQGLAAGFVYYLTKPVAFAQLQAVMSATLGPADGQP
jgi:CheY-like chemotaxis protein